MDADAPGRAVARRIANDLTGHADATIVDLAPERSDGYDPPTGSPSTVHSRSSDHERGHTAHRGAPALSRSEAAAALGMSLRHFRRHVQPHLRCIYSGQLRLYPVTELEHWMHQQDRDRQPRE